jgi:hypothetical protein
MLCATIAVQRGRVQLAAVGLATAGVCLVDVIKLPVDVNEQLWCCLVAHDSPLGFGCLLVGCQHHDASGTCHDAF